MVFKAVINRAKALTSKVVNFASNRANVKQLFYGPPGVRSNVIPLGVASKVGTAAVGAFKGARAALGAASRMTIGQRLGLGAVAAGSAGLTHYASTERMPLGSLRGAAGFAGMALNPAAGSLGFVTGISENIARGGMSMWNKFQSGMENKGIPWVNMTPNMPGMKAPSEYFQDVKDMMPDFEVNMPQMPQMPNIQMPSLSFSAGGGGMDMGMILALLAGAGLTGYAVGRKRKKKRYKKRKRSRYA